MVSLTLVACNEIYLSIDAFHGTLMIVYLNITKWHMNGTSLTFLYLREYLFKITSDIFESAEYSVNQKRNDKVFQMSWLCRGFAFVSDRSFGWVDRALRGAVGSTKL